jgi:hypothetical protein
VQGRYDELLAEIAQVLPAGQDDDGADVAHDHDR